MYPGIATFTLSYMAIWPFYGLMVTRAQLDRQTDRKRFRPPDKQIDRTTERQTYSQTDRILCISDRQTEKTNSEIDRDSERVRK